MGRHTTKRCPLRYSRVAREEVWDACPGAQRVGRLAWPREKRPAGVWRMLPCSLEGSRAQLEEAGDSRRDYAPHIQTSRTRTPALHMRKPLTAAHALDGREEKSKGRQVTPAVSWRRRPARRCAIPACWRLRSAFPKLHGEKSRRGVPFPARPHLRENDAAVATLRQCVCRTLQICP